MLGTCSLLGLACQRLAFTCPDPVKRRVWSRTAAGRYQLSHIQSAAQTPSCQQTTEHRLVSTRCPLRPRSRRWCSTGTSLGPGTRAPGSASSPEHRSRRRTHWCPRPQHPRCTSSVSGAAKSWIPKHGDSDCGWHMSSWSGRPPRCLHLSMRDSVVRDTTAVQRRAIRGPTFLGRQQGSPPARLRVHICCCPHRAECSAGHSCRHCGAAHLHFPSRPGAAHHGLAATSRQALRRRLLTTHPPCRSSRKQLPA